VIADHVPFIRYAFEQRQPVRVGCLHADNEEVSRYLPMMEHVENEWRFVWIRPVVDGQRYSAHGEKSRVESETGALHTASDARRVRAHERCFPFGQTGVINIDI